ncbi:hypothetical protein O6H91_16G006300 [Diphasiastrum complanatum]|uniref:Uncharacterized protein n=1 Tax=Diphasiastrum complanatum TaxID=34168 RepID=A0ACC2B9M3_DIPCM|nr:hypothetical protein O6H91_16G006300 [Diphasiastrum complanatum]
MGSEGVQSTRIYITGFKKFHGVFENPTEVIVSRLKDFMKGHELPSGATLGSCTVLETAGEGALNNLLKVLDSAISEEDSGTQPGEKIDGAQRIVWVHFGVNSGATRFAVERRAVNEATFRCPDEMGWQPQGEVTHGLARVLDRREWCLRNRLICEYLVAWHGRPLFDATWETSHSLCAQYPSFAIADDVT